MSRYFQYINTTEAEVVIYHEHRMITIDSRTSMITNYEIPWEYLPRGVSCREWK